MHKPHPHFPLAQRAAVALGAAALPALSFAQGCRSWRTRRAAPATASWRPSATTATTSSCSWPCWWWASMFIGVLLPRLRHLRGNPHWPQDVGPVRPHGRHRRRAARDRHLAAHRSHRHPVSEAGMSEQQHVRADGTVTFLPHRLNRHPVVVRGLTADELWICCGLSGAAGLLVGAPLSWVFRHDRHRTDVRCPGRGLGPCSSAAASCAALKRGAPRHLALSAVAVAHRQRAIR
ncbi:conjugative transfer region protein [Pseudomonas aeruginosa]|nr:conjugative transfer region protein [Pseudomonas aeruginosa]